MSAGRDYPLPPRLGRVWVRLAVSCVLVVAIATIGCSRREVGGSLAARANAYWQLKQAKRWDEVYDDYLDPTLKGALSKDAFLKKRLLAFDILSFTITDATENGDEGVVRAKADANIPLRMVGGKVQITRKEITGEDSWVRRDGVWYVHLGE